jgi:hypothetical protein
MLVETTMVQDQLCSVANTVRNKKDLSTLLLAAVIAPPAFLATKVNAPGGSVQVRVYDRNHRD